MIGPFVALAAAAGGFVATATAAVVASGTEIVPWAQVGGTATAVGALAYVAKLLADGRLVAQPVAELIRLAAEREKEVERSCVDRERHLEDLISEIRAEAKVRERRLEDLAADVRSDAEALRSLLIQGMRGDAV